MPRHQQGFTLIEVIVIMTLIGILSAYATSRFSRSDTFEARGYYDELVSATRYAQRYAVASGCPVTINIQSNSYSLALAAPCSAGTPVMAPSGGNFAGATPSGVTTGGSVGSYTFTAWGDILSASDIPLSVSGGGSTLSLTIRANSGFVDLP